jgi:UDP-glucose 4-epimerase
MSAGPRTADAGRRHNHDHVLSILCAPGSPRVREAYPGRRVMITGGLGFIGSNLARELVRRGSDVTLLDSLIPNYGGRLDNAAELRDQVKLNISDVRDRHSLRHLLARQDVIFNLAGQTSHLDSMSDPHTDLEINCTSQLSLLETCREVNPRARIVFASTRQIYGRPRYLPVDEDHPLNPVDVNGINKTAGEWYHLLYGQLYGLRVTALRLTNTYGPRMRIADSRQTFLGAWIRAVLGGEPITVLGSGEQLRDFTYVDDAVDAFLLAAAEPRAVGRVYNLGGLQPISLRALAERVIAAAGGDGTYAFAPFPPERLAIDIGDYYADASRIEHELGWRPRVPLEDGLARTIVFYRGQDLAGWLG